MTYDMETRKKVEAYIMRHSGSLKTNVQRLGTDVLRVRSSSFNLILNDLIADGKILVKNIKTGNRKFIFIYWKATL